MRWGIQPLRAVLLTIFVALLALPAGALAAVPENDDFADREVLPSGFPMGLPIEATGSNVEATKEDGEDISDLLSPAGHSIWFEWEAAATDWVSIGSCGTGFPTILNVFTGTKVDELTSVLKINGSEGPGCAGENQVKYTFKATSGTKYVIAVDGNSYTGPEVVPVQTEGEVFLRIEETQPPSNDDFVDAEPLAGRIGEEPNGNRFFSAVKRGNNWTATTEPNEPAYGAGAGASVWYEWTVPVDATYFIGPCCGPQLKWGLYSGASLDDLTQVFLGDGSKQMALTAGTTFRIAVFGSLDGVTGEPTMGSFTFLVRADLPPLPKPQPEGEMSTPPDVTAPQTTISRKLLKRNPPVFKFGFRSSEPGGTFRCSLDRQPFKSCGSSKTFKKPLPGRHRLRVYAVDSAGNRDSSPAVAHFQIPKPKPRPKN